MKKLVLLFSITLVGFSCIQKGQYTITGTASLPELEGKCLYLNKYNAEGVEKSDSVVIEGGKFSFSGIQEVPEVYYLLVESEENGLKKYPILLEQGNFVAAIGEAITVSGTPTNNSYQMFVGKQKDLQDQMDKIYEEVKKAKEDGTITPELEQSQDEKDEALYNQLKEVYTSYFVENIKNPLGQEIFASLGRRLNEVQLAQVLGNADDAYKATEKGAGFVERLDNMNKTAIGQKFTDIISKTPEGNTLSLSEYAGRGKYLLLDFWAAWCPPCRAEMPNLVALYAQYKDKNFEIVGYSLDRDAAAWMKGIADLQMTWPQMSDVKYWQSEPVKQYAVQGIPHTVLLDPDGIIIYKNLRSNDLENKLKELLK